MSMLYDQSATLSRTYAGDDECGAVDGAAERWTKTTTAARRLIDTTRRA